MLSDARLRQIYDQTGSVENDEVNAAKDGDGRDWEAYWRELFPPVTQAAVAQFEAQYKGSAEEADDLARAYEAGQGDMAHILVNVYFGTVDQEQRYRDVLQPLIDAGTLKAYRAFTHETKAKRDARVRKAKREAAEAEAMASEVRASLFVLLGPGCLICHGRRRRSTSRPTTTSRPSSRRGARQGWTACWPASRPSTVRHCCLVFSGLVCSSSRSFWAGDKGKGKGSSSKKKGSSASKK